MKQESFFLHISKIVLNVTFIIYLGIALGLIIMVSLDPDKFSMNEGGVLKTDKSDIKTKNIVAGMAEYSNKEFDFKFNYPEKWLVEDMTNDGFYNVGEAKSLLMLTLEGEREDDGGIWIEIKKGNDVDSVISGYIDNYCIVGGGVGTDEKIMIGGVEGRLIHFNDYCETEIENPWIFVAHEQNVYIFGIPLGAKFTSEIFNEIISSVRFNDVDAGYDVTSGGAGNVFDRQPQDENSEAVSGNGIKTAEALRGENLLKQMFAGKEISGWKVEDKDIVSMGLSLGLETIVEKTFIAANNKSSLAIARLKGTPHAGGLDHAYIAVFNDKDKIVTTPVNNIFNDSGGLDLANSHIGGDNVSFSFYDCKGATYIFANVMGCPNGGLCMGDGFLLRVKNGKFENTQSIFKDIIKQSEQGFQIGEGKDKLLIYNIQNVNTAYSCVKPNCVGEMESYGKGKLVSIYSKDLFWNNMICKFEDKNE